jgi:hypothetical protein
MIEILPPLGKYKYDTWRILPVTCYIDNSVRLHVNKPQGEELRQIYPFSNNYFNCIFNSANSLGVILYGRLEIGVVSG